MYNYEDFKGKIFLKEYQKMLVEMVTKIASLPNEFTMQDALITGDTWMMIACVDYLCELGFLKEIDPNPEKWGQHRIFEKNI